MKQIIAILMIINFSFVLGQEKQLKRANDKFEDYAFIDAIASYEDLVKEGNSDENIFKQLGNANYANARYESAAEWYGKLVKLANANIEADDYYRYAQSLKSLGDYTGSDFWMQKFEANKADDQRVKNFVEQEDYLARIKENSGRYDIKSLDINSAVSDFAPSFHGEELVFSTARDTGIVSRNVHNWNNGAFLNLYKAPILEGDQLGSPERLSKALNTKTHESSSIFTKDGNTMYFTRNNSENRKFARDSKGISRLKLYRSTFNNGVWEKAVELPFNSDEYSVAHPALSTDDKTLYFSSDMPGTLGASDIFKVTVNDDGSYGTPENLGNTINTEARESFPFVANDILYFSSDGHPGLGGLDVFATNLDTADAVAVNLGEPLNSKQDDFSYIINSEGKGYFASNREGGKGDDDIYSFTETSPLLLECSAVLAGIVTDQETGSPLPLSKIVVMSDGKTLAESQADENGGFELELPCEAIAYKIIASKAGYLPDSSELTLAKGKSAEVALTLDKEKSPAPVAGTDLIKILNLAPINFDLDKFNIRPDAGRILDKVAAYLKEYPEVNVAIASHTDVKASSRYNQILSERRAKSTMKYLQNKGIAASRMSATGYGETKLINDCTVWKFCSPEKNEENRRSEIIVIK